MSSLHTTPLDLPELLSLVLLFLARDKALYPTLFVNRSWHTCASRILYRRVNFDESSGQLASLEKFAEIYGAWKHETSNGGAGDDQTHEGVHQQSPTQRGINFGVITQSSAGRITTLSGELGGHVDSVQPHVGSSELGTVAAGTAGKYNRRASMARCPRRSSTTNIVTRSRALSSPAPPTASWVVRNSLRQKQPQAGDESLDDLTIFSPLSCVDASLAAAGTRATPSLLQTYRSHLRTLTLRKIKDKSINDPLQAIAEYARNITSFDFYICDYLLDSTVLAFVTIHQPSPITHISLAGCHRITDAVVFSVARHCPNLQHLDLRACSLISDASIIEIAHSCPQLNHLNVGRIRQRDRITDNSILPLAELTQISVLGLAGCDVSDECLFALAEHRGFELERISINNCPRITDRFLRVFVNKCKKLTVLELKDCQNIADWEALTELAKRKVLLTLCDRQKKACEKWSRNKGKPVKVMSPVKFRTSAK